MEIREYWSQYYREEIGPEHPSAFAMAISTQLRSSDVVVDLGCGNGRDAIHFASRARTILAVDSSPEALVRVRDLAATSRTSGVQTLLVDFAQSPGYEGLHQAVSLERAADPTTRVVCYARFLLHAVTLETQALLFDQLSKLLVPGSGPILSTARETFDQ